ncbi:DUF4307 domain-containing protein [Nocardioides sp. InS609-2]|uniref:DUF4307 domain-containing protein n=1 Tax=Nocardioides sp. InS609-2 TaxID=2760705 RepID=UPI0017B01286|nr:DUF4307 domain-containing protein [Nocardioides sp. InS609-2]MBA3782572.1 DUF4307 domain-containing protein [Nocardioides sp.]
MTSETELADRYGAPTAGRRRLVVIAVVCVAAVCLGWLGWTAWFHVTPDVRSELVGFSVVSTHETTAEIDVSVDDAVDASCTVRAYSADHTTVGELTFEPVNGRNSVAVRTEREATSIENIGCTAPGQPRPR